MKTSLSIRKARRTDRKAITKLVRAYPDKLMQNDLPITTEFVVATLGKEVIGCCALAVYSKRLAEVRSLAVAPAHQGKGIATILIEKCLEVAKRKNIHEVITITGAKALFEKRGFNVFNNEKFALFKLVRPTRVVKKRRG